MKRLFTLLLSMVAFSTASFATDTQELTLSSWGASWGCEYDTESYVVTYSTNWGGCRYWIGGENYSAYRSVTVTFKTEMTTTIKLVVEQYDETNTTSSSFAEASITGSGDGTVNQSIIVPLGDDATNISQIYIQAGTGNDNDWTSGGTLTLVSAVLNPQSDCVELYSSAIGDGLALSEWKNNTTLGTDVSSSTPELIASGLAETGNIMVFTLTGATEDSGWGFKLVEGHWGHTYIAISENGSTDATNPFEAYADLETNGGVYALTITKAMLDSINTAKWWGGEFIVQGDGVTLSKIEVMTAASFKENYSSLSAALPVQLDINGYTTYSSSSAFTVSRGTACKASVSDATVNLTAIEDGAIPAGAGVVLTGLDMGTVTVRTTTDSATEITGNELIGVTSADGTAASGTNYVLANNGTITKFVLFGTSTTLADLVNKAYLNVEDNSEVKSLSIVFNDDETTGINNVAVKAEKAEGAIYNLAGQKVTESYKGVVIKNGKKYVNR